jgi:hypothetical protein
MPFEPAQIVVGAILGLAGAGTLRFWQYGRDIWIANVDECCTSIFDASRVATEYWTLPKIDIDSIVSTTSEQIESHQKQVLNEAYLLGYQTKIDRSFDVITERISHRNGEKNSDLLDKFRDALTGGNYGSVSRTADHERARQAQVFASELVADIRHSSQRALSIKGIAIYYAEGFTSFWKKYFRP